MYNDHLEQSEGQTKVASQGQEDRQKRKEEWNDIEQMAQNVFDWLL
jgi:hypothetical protein